MNKKGIDMTEYNGVKLIEISYCGGNAQRLCEYDECLKCYNRSLASNPRVVKCWISGDKGSSRRTMKHSNLGIILKCDVCSHVFDTQPENITRGRWCKYCANKNLCTDEACQICFRKSFASDDRSQFWSKKNVKRARDVFKSSNFKYWFDCPNPECKHEFESVLNDMTSYNTWCGYCCQGSRIFCEKSKIKECKPCFDKSFASHYRSTSWSKRNTEFPHQVTKNSHYKYFFNCDNQNCAHEFESTIYAITCGNSWCGYCCQGSRIFCEKSKTGECRPCFDKSFASQIRAKNWSQLNEKKPHEVTKGTSSKYKFDCDKCPHTFEISLGHVLDNKWCPYCRRGKLCGDPECNHCYMRSFASHPKVTHWSKKNKLHPLNVTRGCNTFFIFDCDKCNREFTTSPCRITLLGSWCPYHTHKTESKVYDYLDLNYKVKYQYNIPGCVNTKTNSELRYDFTLEGFNIIIELDGNQHFKQVSNWEPPEHNRELDIHKMSYALSKGYSMIRLLQEEVFKDKYDWMKLLLNAIKSYETATLILITNSDVYETHLNKLKEYIKNNSLDIKYNIEIIDPYKAVFEDITEEEAEEEEEKELKIDISAISSLIQPKVKINLSKILKYEVST